MLKKILYSIGLVVFLVILFSTLQNSSLKNLVTTLENRSFDIRQNLIINSGHKKANKDIVIVTIDDASYEYILNKYGEWPMPREIYTKVIELLEQDNPKAIAFDLMFVKSLKSKQDADNKLANTFAKYQNVYTAMNFDNQSVELRIPVELPDKLKVKVNNLSEVNFESLTYQNCRAILPEIIQSTDKIGMINVSRADDGVIRKMPVFIKYQNDFYPQLAFKLGLSLIGNKDTNFTINKNSILKFQDRKIYLDENGSAILNWYGPTGTYQQIPIYKLIKVIENESAKEYNFENKIVYFGTTAASLFDIKTTPTSKLYPGVEVQATYLNNILDNNFIIRVNKNISLIVAIVLAIITGFIVLNVISPVLITLSFISIYSAYILFGYYLMKFGNYWISIVPAVLLGLLVFVICFVVKYIIKSRDFDQQYKLATTDGLTELYNHRYFQEQMKMQVEQSKRYGTPFSLIIIDIDYFKKFNDKFGHQAGDAVLRQVAQILKTNIRATDVACRYGGEEMSIILPNTSKDLSFVTAEKICKRVANNKFKLNNNDEENVTISLGVATFPDDGDTASEIIEAADKRLYQSKHNGRNQVN